MFTVVAAVGCARVVEEGDLAGLGLRDANSEPPPGLLRPITDGDLAAVQQRGQLLHQLERTVALAYEQGVMKVGDPGSDAVLPVVDVDPGGRSAQVLFVRWKPGLDGQMPVLLAEHAERWLLVSLLLSPDQVLDVELLAGKVPKGSHLARRIDTLVAAADQARYLAAGVPFHLFDVYEQVPVDPAKPIKGDKIVARVYALSTDGKGPDLQIDVDPPRRRHEAEVLVAAVVHVAGVVQEPALRIETANPGPVTVARAMLRGAEAGSVPVQSPRGTWTVSAASGLLQRAESTTPAAQ